jgi:hypothetical protein
VPIWSAYPAVGFGDRDVLPTLRSDAADRLVGWGGTVTKGGVFARSRCEGCRPVFGTRYRHSHGMPQAVAANRRRTVSLRAAKRDRQC